jgi:putative transposase
LNSPIGSGGGRGEAVEATPRDAGAKEFKVAPFRWRVERTFAWLGRWYRLSKDCEGTTASSEAFIKSGMIHLLARRLPGVLRKR